MPQPHRRLRREAFLKDNRYPLRFPAQNKFAFFACICLVIFVGVVVYQNSFQGVFLYDDNLRIVKNEAIRTLSFPWKFIQNTRRPVLFLTIAVNYAFGGLNPFGYHCVNLVIHLIAGLLLFGIIRQSFLFLEDHQGLYKESLFFAVAVSLIWVVHPLQTQSVTYIIQRAESLMGMFYLLTIYCSIRFFVSRSFQWILAAGLACLLGGLTKEVIITAPVVILLYDRSFVSGSFREALSKHKNLYLGLMVTWIVMLYLLLTVAPLKNPASGFSIGRLISLHRIWSQPGVVLHYLKLVFWPAELVFDYEWPFPKTPWETLGPLAVIIILIGASFWAIKSYPKVGFLALSFFIILLPSSSFIPLKLAFEHRMYLPLACVVILSVLAIRHFLINIIRHDATRKKTAAILLSCTVIFLGHLTFERNKDYHSELRMWQDVVQKRPSNSRAQNNLGEYLLRRGKLNEALKYFSKAISLNPGYADAHLNMGSTLAQKRKLKEAIDHTREAIRLEPDYAVAYNNLGAALMDQGKYQQAVSYFKKSLELGFRDAGVYYNCAVALLQIRQTSEAKFYLQEALRLNSSFQQARKLLSEFKDD